MILVILVIVGYLLILNAVAVFSIINLASLGRTWTIALTFVAYIASSYALVKTTIRDL